jgi:hypothetical protein
MYAPTSLCPLDPIYTTYGVGGVKYIIASADDTMPPYVNLGAADGAARGFRTLVDAGAAWRAMIIKALKE